MIVRAAAVSVIQSALSAVEAERQLINDLNVYPVPDGDTGTNMALTVRAVVEELEQSDVTDIPSVAAAVTKGSLMGARGNSGVILSQIVRGICDVWGQANSLDTAVFKQAVMEGQHAAYRAVKEPVEGTMLTVIREMATAAQAVPDGLGLEHLLAAVEEAGRVAVENTTAQLPALQKAGVVDAGGYGLLDRGAAAEYAFLKPGPFTRAPSTLNRLTTTWTTVIELWVRYADPSAYQTLAAVRDAARVLGQPYATGDRIAKAMPPLIMGRDTPLYACLEPHPKFEDGYKMAADLRGMYETDPDAKAVIDVARGLEGLRRQDGIHAAAVVITKDELTDYLPIQRKPESGQDPDLAPVAGMCCSGVSVSPG